MVQLIQIKPSDVSKSKRYACAGNPASPNGQNQSLTDALAVRKLEMELEEHRYYLERKVEQRTEQLLRRVNLMESCNATLCAKLAEAKREIATLRANQANANPALN